MALPKDVQSAVAAADAAVVGCDDTIGVRQWQTIRAHLLSQEAEIDRLTRGNIGYAQDNANLIGRGHVAVKRAELAESRLAAANALLRDMRDGAFNIGGWADAIDEYFQEHLQGSGDEA